VFAGADAADPEEVVAGEAGEPANAVGYFGSLVVAAFDFSPRMDRCGDEDPGGGRFRDAGVVKGAEKELGERADERACLAVFEAVDGVANGSFVKVGGGREVEAEADPGAICAAVGQIAFECGGKRHATFEAFWAVHRLDISEAGVAEVRGWRAGQIAAARAGAWVGGFQNSGEEPVHQVERAVGKRFFWKRR
jgi:hypothetical protein